MGELSESLKKISLGSILVVVGIISILTMAIYWYVFSKDPSSIPYLTADKVASSPERSSSPESGRLSAEPARTGPDDRTVIVETPSSDIGDDSSIRSDAAEDAVTGAASRQDVIQPGTPVETGNLSIQVGAFSKAEGAERLADELSNKGFSYLVKSSDGMYRVFVGDFSSKEQAAEVLARLKQSGFSGYVRSVP